MIHLVGYFADKKQVNRRYKALILPIIFLCAMTSYSAYSLFRPNDRLFLNKKKPTTDAHFIQKKNKRGIASIKKTNTINFDCNKENQPIKVDSPQVLIKFENCQTGPKVAQYSLINQTNQYMAQIFKPTGNIIVTDFIQLARGENILKFEISLNDKQKKTQTIKIERRTSEIQ